MATRDSTKKSKLSDVDLERIGNEINDVSLLINSIRELVMLHQEAGNVRSAGAALAGIQALCEKAGVMADRCASELGGCIVAGSFEAWARLDHSAAEAAAEVRVNA